MGYYDGNTVTALGNYAQHYAMSDNSYYTGFGASTPGVIDLVSGNTGTVDLAHTTGDISGDVVATTVIGDPDPFYDDCGSPEQIAMTGSNVGDLLNAKGVTWGWFQGGFTPTTPASATSPAVCAAATTNLGPFGLHAPARFLLQRRRLSTAFNSRQHQRAKHVIDLNRR